MSAAYNAAMDGAKTWLTAGLAAGAWLVTATMVYNMLSGDFEERVCRTGCVQALYGSALVLALAGLATAWFARRDKKPTALVGFWASLLLLGVFATTMLVGVVRTTFNF